MDSKIIKKLIPHHWRLKKVSQLPGPSVLVLAPHPDDEIIGCGGTLIAQANVGCKVSILFLTNGALGGHNNKNIIQIRKSEALEASKIIGAQEIIFWDEPDNGLKNCGVLQDKLSQLLVEKKPNIVYIPWFIAEHPDHIETACLLRSSLENIQPSFVSIMAYEVWAPLFPNLFINISQNIKSKEAALNSYKSQQDVYDISDLALYLNRYRALRFRSKAYNYVEAFYEMGSELFANLIDVFCR